MHQIVPQKALKATSKLIPNLFIKGPHKEQSTALSAPRSMQARSVYHCSSYQTIRQLSCEPVWCFTHTPTWILYCQKSSWCISFWHHTWRISAHCNEILLCLPGGKNMTVPYYECWWNIESWGRSGQEFFNFYFSHWLEQVQQIFIWKSEKQQNTCSESTDHSINLLWPQQLLPSLRKNIKIMVNVSMK